MTCTTCSTTFSPDTYAHHCNACGDELNRQYEQVQGEGDDGQLTLAQVAARAAGNIPGPTRRRWTVE